MPNKLVKEEHQIYSYLKILNHKQLVLNDLSLKEAEMAVEFFPDVEVIDINKATAGDLVFLNRYQNPVMILGSENDQQTKYLVELGGETRIYALPEDRSHPCIKLNSEWRMRLKTNKKLKGNALSLECGKIALTSEGRLLRSVMKGGFEEEVLVDLERYQILATCTSTNYSFAASWTIEVESPYEGWIAITALIGISPN